MALVVFGAESARGQVAPLVDLETTPAMRNSGVGLVGVMGEEILLTAYDRYGSQHWLTAGTAATTRKLDLLDNWVISAHGGVALFYQPDTGRLTTFADGGLREVLQPPFPADGGSWAYVARGALGQELLVERCASLFPLTCDLLAVRPGSARRVPWLNAYDSMALSLGTAVLLLRSQPSLQWMLFDGQTYAPLTGVPPQYGRPFPIDDNRALLELNGRLFLVASDGGSRELLPAFPPNQNFEVVAATSRHALVVQDPYSFGYSDQNYLVPLSGDAGPVNLGSCRNPTSAVVSEDRLFFKRAQCYGSALSPSNYYDAEPWVVEVDGGIRLVADVNGTDDSVPQFLTSSLGSSVFFIATRGSRTEYWVSDGTPAGTIPLGLLASRQVRWLPVPALSAPRFLAFRADLPDGTMELGITDGTAAGTSAIDLSPGTLSSSPQRLLAARRRVSLLAAAADGGTSLTTVSIDGGARRWLSGALSSFGEQAALGEQVQLAFDDGLHGSELWLVPGADGGPGLLDLEPGREGSRPRELVAVGARMLFSASTTTSGRELWISDGTAAGSHLVADLRPGPASGGPRALAALDGGVVFFADDGLSGDEPWFSDGTPGGTVLLRNLAPGPPSSRGANLVSSGQVAWFSADDGISGLELWKTDGTPAGTSRVTDLLPGPQGSNPVPRIARGGRLVFTAALPSGRVVALTDGTPGGTRTLLTLGSKRFEVGVASPSKWYFVLEEADVRTLFVSAGTAATTVPVRTWTGASSTWLRALGEAVAFNATSQAGEELWLSDGTDGGTRSISDIAAGRLDAWPGPPAQLGTRLVFAATDVNDDREPWTYLLPPALDNTPPFLSVAVTGQQRNGWYISTTELRFEVEEPDSPLTELTGCEPIELMAEGVVTQQCHARSAGGASDLPVVLRRDVTAPLIQCPTELRVEAQLDAGALVPFEVLVSDSVDPAPTLAVTPSPNSLFSVGRTTVRATATDEAGHRSACSFEVLVLPLPVENTALPPPTQLPPTGCGCAGLENAASAWLLLLALGAWLRRPRLVLVPALALATLAGAAAPRSKPKPSPVAAPAKLEAPAAALARVSALYDALEYERVVTEASALLARPELPLDVRIEAYRIQGCARAIVADPVDAEQPFRLLLRARPDYELPDSTPPKILAVFRKVQSEERALALTLKQVDRKRLIESLRLRGDPPKEARGGQPLLFSWRLKDPLGVVDTVELPWRKAGQRGFSSLALERSADGTWQGRIPAELTASETGFQLEYFVRTADAEGVLLARGDEAAPLRVSILPGRVTSTRVRPIPPAVFWTSTALTIVSALVAGAFTGALVHQEKIYRDGALAGRPGAELVSLAADGRAWATVANVGWGTAGVAGVVSLVMLPFTRFDTAPTSAP